MIILIGPLPPPMHGAARITQAVKDLCEESGIPVCAISTSPASLRRSPLYHWRRLRAFVKALATILNAPQGTRLYLTASGGWGWIYDIAYACAARFKSLPLLVHHHSFAYLDQSSPLTKWFVKLAGPRQVHVVLGPGMARRLTALYPRAGEPLLVSNAAFQGEPAPSPRAGPLRSIGFFSNVTREKGIDRFIDLVAALRNSGFDGSVCIAGPVPDPKLADQLRLTARRLDIDLLGAIQEAPSRDALFAGIDLLVLPSRYANEAEPLVILEAQQRGVAVAATDRGCIADMLVDHPGMLLDRDATDLAPLTAAIIALARDGEAMTRLRMRTMTLAGARFIESRTARRHLLNVLNTTSP